MAYEGTGITAGPYAISSGFLSTYNDPNARGGQVSDRIQIQNASNYLIQVSTSGPTYTIQPQQATTIPTIPGGQSITVSVPTQNAQTAGTVTIIWQLPGQSSPITDGPLTGLLNTQSVLVPFQTGVLNGSTLYFSQSLALPQDSQSVIIQIAQLIGTFPSSGVRLYVKGDATGFIYLDENFTSDLSNYTVSCQVFGDTDSSVTIFLGGLGACSVNYALQIIASSSPYIAPTYSTVTVVGKSAYPLDTVTYGGLQSIYQTGISAGVTTTMLAAPASGLAYRLHSWSVNKAITVAGDFLQLQSSTAGQVYDIATANSTGRYLGGLLVTTDVQIHNQSAATQYAVWIGYDTVTRPVIS